MVSFQCDGCADVVKKPKLDQHRGRCGASFTCIDCSKTFPTPVDWKGHTSCISEAEKYQKSLYKAKPNGGGRESAYGNGSGGKFQVQGGSWNRPPARSQATGANGTPLGTPPRMSPVTAPLLRDEKTRTVVPDATVESLSKEDPKKHKKRKSEVTNATHVEPVTQGADVPISREEPEADQKDKRKKEKKERKEKKDKHVEPAVLEAGPNGADPLGVSQPLPADVTRPKKSKKEKKERRDKDEPVIPIEGASNGVDPATLSSSLLTPAVAGDEKSGESKKEKKKKKDKKDKETNEVKTLGTVQDVPVEAPSADVDMVNGEEEKEGEKKKKKKRKSEIDSGELEVNGEVDATPSKERKTKKRKRETEEPDVGQESMTNKKKKKKGAVL